MDFIRETNCLIRSKNAKGSQSRSSKAVLTVSFARFWIRRKTEDGCSSSSCSDARNKSDGKEVRYSV